jgi:Arc/MetJ-type ribon-helix-helix transcriptional regulator
VKVSVSLPEEDIEFLDALVREERAESRSAAVHQAVSSLRSSRLEAAYEAAYEAAWADWRDSGDAEVWEPATGDGLDAAR